MMSIMRASLVIPPATPKGSHSVGSFVDGCEIVIPRPIPKAIPIEKKQAKPMLDSTN